MALGEVQDTGGMYTDEDISRWASQIRPFPLTEGYIPRGGAPLSELDDEVLLSAPPHLIAHIQRTASQGGLQVISPRQTPVSALMSRSRSTERQLGDHVVGSTATKHVKWPTLFEDDLDHWLPDVPLCPMPADHALRTRTVTDPLTKAGKALADPILRCLVKGRAVIDILRRDDVAGGADEMTDLLCGAWGIPRAEMDDLDALTLGITGPLLRHAIKTDDVFPMLHAPIQVKRSIGVGVCEATREILPDDTAMDWRRMRVFCEAVYAMCVAVEGHVWTEKTAHPPPGDPVANPVRSHVMCFIPSPGSAWYSGPETFSVMPIMSNKPKKARGIPQEVYRALARYVEVARPVSHILAAGHNAFARRTSALPVEVPHSETITQGYRLMTRCMLVGSARGKTAAATVRNVIYKALENASLNVRLRIVRYIHIAREECRVHLGENVVPDSVVDRIANKFKVVGDMIRREIVAEAGRRGNTPEEWWSDILSQAPERYKSFVEGTVGWTRVALWMIFRSPTDRWNRLNRAMHYGALREIERKAVEGMALPPRYGSAERIEAVGRKVTKRVTMAYAGYYLGVADVGAALADELDARDRPRSASIMREASYLWFLRSRSLRGANVHLIAKDVQTRSGLHTRMEFPGVDLILVPAPYRAFEGYKTHAQMSTILPTNYKMHLQAFHGPAKSSTFKEYKRIILAAPESTVTRYLLKPWELGEAMERGWNELVEDIKIAVRAFAVDVARPPPPAKMPTDYSGLPTQRYMSPKFGYFEMYSQFSEEEVLWAEDLLDELDPAISEEIMAGTYATVGDLRGRMLMYSEGRYTVSGVARETVM